jgi:hypothetical protein
MEEIPIQVQGYFAGLIKGLVHTRKAMANDSSNYDIYTTRATHDWSARQEE